MKIRIRSIFTKIVLWFIVTVALSFAGFVATSMFFTARLSGRDRIITGMHSFYLDEARSAYEEGGPARLSAYLRRLNSFSRTTYYLVDDTAIDLVTGEDRSALVARGSGGRTRPWPFQQPKPKPIRVRSSDDRRYRLVTVVPQLPQRIGLWDSLGYFIWMPLLMGVLCYILAVHLASPLRSLRRALERFGQGDLGIRLHLARRDEIGDLARAFNRMADQITTLLSAERRLLQDVSHELRSPLARLEFAVELVRSSPDIDSALGRIRREAGRLNHLVDEVLQLTRAEGDPHARNPVELSLDELVREVVADCALECEARGCHIDLRINRPAIVTGDRELLHRALENIVRNAIHHAPSKTAVEVDLSADGERATISLRDHGAGVPPEALGEIFKPFYRVEKDRDRSSGGMGLGLAIAHRAVEIHQGRLTALNAQPGLKIVIELPCRAEPVARSSASVQSLPR
jgi:two-component system sensor histidine kinase CpxA